MARFGDGARMVGALLLLAASWPTIAACPSAPARDRLRERAESSQGLPTETTAWERVATAARDCDDAMVLAGMLDEAKQALVPILERRGLPVTG